MCTLLLLLLLTAPVITVASRMQCGPDEHEHDNICCRNCTSGQYVRKPCSENHGVGECEVCGDETYTSHSSGLTYCLPCTQCRKDQEVVANCTRTSNRQCQCKTGFYCESEDREICRPCHSCPEGTVIRHPCNATTDTVCEEEKGKANGDLWLSITPVVRVVIVLAYCLYCYYCKRREKPSEPGGPTPDSSLCTEGGTLAPEVESSLLLEESSVSAPENRTPPSLSEDQEEAVVLHEVVTEGGPGDPGQPPQPCPTANSGPYGLTETSASL